MPESPENRWFPLARGEEIVARHVVHAQLLGQELAVWRDDSGQVNAWENRCPHRGVRLSIGINAGTELRCRYHGWRFAGGSGHCTRIPAHPDLAPARAIRARCYAVTEADGYVWAALGTPEGRPFVLDGRPAVTLRSVFVEAAAGLTADSLASVYRFAPDLEGELISPAITRIDDYSLRAEAGPVVVALMLQPVDDNRTIIHAAATGSPGMAVLRHHQTRLAVVRDAVERVMNFLARFAVASS